MKTGNAVKILWITERFPPMPGGMAVSSKRQVTGLRKTGFHVDVLIFHSGRDKISIKRQKRDGGTDIFISHPDEAGNAAQRAWREVLSQQTYQNYELVFSFGAGIPGYIAVTYAAWLNIPSMVSVRGNDFDRDWFEPKKSYFVKEALERADFIAAVTIEKKEKIQALFPGKIIFWSPNGIDADQFKLLPEEEKESEKLRAELSSGGKRIIGIFGEMKYKKRIPMWLSAVREAGLKDQFRLILTGRMDAETDAVFNDPTLSPEGRHISFRSPEKLLPLYAACDYIVIPSLFEGFPNVLLEAMAAGCIPIVSDAGGMCEAVISNETGFIFSAENRIEAGEATKKALALSEKELEKMKAAVKKHLRDNFSIENEIKILSGRIKAAVY